MPHDDADLEVVLTAVSSTLGDPAGWAAPRVEPALALAVIGAVWGINARYDAVRNVLVRYHELRAADGADARRDTAADLAAAIRATGGPEAFAERMRNRQRTSTRNGILKAEAVLLGADVLAAGRVRTSAGLRRSGPARLERLARAWAQIPGQGSLISWRALLMQAGVPGVKPDRMVQRFVAGAVGRPVTPAAAAELLGAAADRLGVDARVLDAEVWELQSRLALATGSRPPTG